MSESTQNQDKTKVLERIRKLFATASSGSGATEAEVETALRLAKKIMEANDLEEHEVLSHADAAGDRARQTAYDSIVDEKPIKRSTIHQFDRDTACCASLIAGCSYYIAVGRGIRFYGLPVDVAVASALYRELINTMQTMAKVRYGETWCRNPHHHYCDGFALTLRRRAQEMHAAKSENVTSTAIVLCKDALLKRYGNEKLGLITGRPRKAYSSAKNNSFFTGMTDGKSVDIGANNRLGA